MVLRIQISFYVHYDPLIRKPRTELNLQEPCDRCYVSVLTELTKVAPEPVLREARTGFEPVTHIRETGLQSAALTIQPPRHYGILPFFNLVKVEALLLFLRTA